MGSASRMLLTRNRVCRLTTMVVLNSRQLRMQGNIWQHIIKVPRLSSSKTLTIDIIINSIVIGMMVVPIIVVELVSLVPSRWLPLQTTSMMLALVLPITAMQALVQTHRKGFTQIEESSSLIRANYWLVVQAKRCPYRVIITWLTQTDTTLLQEECLE